MAETVDWNALAAQVQANFAATGQWFAPDSPALPEPVDWNALAAQVQANFAATGQWFVGGDSGPEPSRPVITRVSTAADGTQGNGDSFGFAADADGTRVAFESDASNLVPGDTNGTRDIFVKDLATGAVTRASTTAGGEQGNGLSFGAAFSPDGTRVAFASDASNLVPGDTNRGWDVFVKDLATGAVTRASTTADGGQGNGLSFSPAFSADGTRLTFGSDATNLVPGDTNGATDIFLKDLATGAVTRLSTAADGTQGNAGSYGAALSADGRLLAFESAASNLVPGDTNGVRDIFLKDLVTGVVTRASTTAGGEQADGQSDGPYLSADGTRLAFNSRAGNLVPGDSNGFWDVFVKDLVTGAVTRVSAEPADYPTAGGSLSADGTKVAFALAPPGYVIFVEDLATGALTLANPALDGGRGNTTSSGVVLLGDGSKVGFTSYASNLVPGDTNGVADVFISDLAGASGPAPGPDAPEPPRAAATDVSVLG